MSAQQILPQYTQKDFADLLITVDTIFESAEEV
jgi:hypothetical protein